MKSHTSQKAPLSRRKFCLAGLVCLCSTAANSAQENRLTFAELYDIEPEQGLKLSAKLQSLAGQSVTMQGFMAPPLKAESDFFVLTRFPMSVCPFCSAEADWPSDIVVVYMAAAQTLSPSRLIRVTGRLETGLKMDPTTAFVSLIRLVEASWIEV